MPIWLWLLIGGAGAYLIATSATAAASTAGGSVTQLAVKAVNGNTYSVPVDANLTAEWRQEILTFFATAGQSNATVQNLSTQLGAAGFTVAAGSVQNLWAMVGVSSGTLVNSTTPATSSGGGAPLGGYHGLGSLAPTKPVSASPLQVVTHAPITKV